MSMVEIEIDKKQFNKDLFLQRLPTSMQMQYDSGLCHEHEGGIRLGMFFGLADNTAEKEGHLRELNKYFRSLPPDTYLFKCTGGGVGRVY
jgi:hypothetical protein